MKIKIRKSDLIWSYASQFFQFGTTLMLLPLILKAIPSEELGIWYVFLSVTALVGLLDFGFQGTTSVNVSYIFSGANEIVKEGVARDSIDHTKVNFRLLANLIKTVRRIYLVISLVAFILLIGPGSIYIFWISSGMFNQNTVMGAWILNVFSLTLSLYFAYYGPLMVGRGQVKESKVIVVVSRSLSIVLTYLTMFFGWGLMALALGGLIQTIVIRILSIKYFFNEELKKDLNRFMKEEKGSLFSVLWFNSRKSGLVAVGSFLILKANTLISATFLSPKEVATYGLSIQLFEFVARIASLMFYAYLPQLNSARAKNDLPELRRIFSISWVVSVGVFVIGSILIILLGNIILHSFHTTTSLLPTGFLLLICVTAGLEVNHSIAASMISTANKIPYTIPSLLSGAGIVAISVLLLNLSNLGLLSLIISQFIVQIAYNNWKWPVVLMKDLETSYSKLANSAILQISSRLKQLLEKS